MSGGGGYMNQKKKKPEEEEKYPKKVEGSEPDMLGERTDED
jgi:hypothetical protein